MRAGLRRALALAAVLLLGGALLAGCGKKNEPDPPNGPDKATGVRPYPRS